MKIILPVSVILAIIGGVFAAQAEMKLPDLKKQPSAQAVLDEHFAALNKCDWNRQNDFHISLPFWPYDTKWTTETSLRLETDQASCQKLLLRLLTQLAL